MGTCRSTRALDLRIRDAASNSIALGPPVFNRASGPFSGATKRGGSFPAAVKNQRHQADPDCQGKKHAERHCDIAGYGYLGPVSECPTKIDGKAGYGLQ